MKAAVLALSMLFVVGCSEHYRYKCQDPVNKDNKECNRPDCEVTGECWDKLSGHSSSDHSDKQESSGE